MSKAVLGSGIVVLGAVASWDAWVTYRHRKVIHDDVEDVPHRRCGLVLGTSPVLANGAKNHYYQYRIEAAALLYQYGKIDVVVVSGSDNGVDYSEPEAMRHDLQQLGVPASQIVMDKGGARTIDSVMYAQSQSLMGDWLIISQAFHNQRSLVLARHFNLNAHAYNARDVQGGWRVHVRERFARMRMAWDMLTGRFGSVQIPAVTASVGGSDKQDTESMVHGLDANPAGKV